MKITCNRQKLLNVFQRVAAVTPTRSPKTILQSAKLVVTDNTAMFMATDLEVGIRIQLLDLEIKMPGSVILPVARFGSILRETTTEQLNIEGDLQGICIHSDRSQFRLPAGDPKEFPEVGQFCGNDYHELPARLLREIIRRTVFATDTESSRYALGGVLLELEKDRVIAVSTDGRRLAKMEGPAITAGQPEVTGNTIVPSRALQLIERTLLDSDAEIQLAIRENELLVKSQRVTIASRLLEGRFPRWRDVFPDQERAVKIELSVGPLHAAVRQAAIVTNEESRGIEFRFGQGTLLLTGKTAETGEAKIEVPIDYDGDELTITLDPRFLGEFLKVLDPEKTVRLTVKDSQSAAVFITDDDYGYVIMPMAKDKSAP